jgi:hypothetical protein
VEGISYKFARGRAIELHSRIYCGTLLAANVDLNVAFLIGVNSQRFGCVRDSFGVEIADGVGLRLQYNWRVDARGDSEALLSSKTS